VQPDTAIRSELKQWVFANVEPCQEHSTAFIIRQVSTGRYYAGKLKAVIDEPWAKRGDLWADSLSSHSIRQFPRVQDARAEFHWSLWLGNWFDSFLPRKWRRVIPWRQFEIVEVYNVWEYCDWNTPYPCRHRRTSL
jgi:hypothetical protein